MDDSNAGKWVQHAIRKHSIEVELATSDKIGYEVASSCIDMVPTGETNRQGNGCAAYYPGKRRNHHGTVQQRRACQASTALNDTKVFAAEGECCACDGWSTKRTVCCSRLNVTGGEGVQPAFMGIFVWVRHISHDHRPVYLNALGNYLYFGGRQNRWIVAQDYTTPDKELLNVTVASSDYDVTVASSDYDVTGCPDAARNKFGVVRKGSTVFDSAGNPNRDPWDHKRPITVSCADPQHFARTAAVNRVQSITAFALGAAHMCESDANTWLNVFPTTANGCAALVVADPKCSNKYLNYAAQGDRNCGCLQVGTKCEHSRFVLDWGDTKLAKADREYGIVAFRIELNHSSYKARPKQEKTASTAAPVVPPPAAAAPVVPPAAAGPARRAITKIMAAAAKKAQEERLAAEAEARRVAMEAQLAAEAEAARVAKERRLAEEAEARHAAAEAEAEAIRVAEEAAAARATEERMLGANAWNRGPNCGQSLQQRLLTRLERLIVK